MRENDGHRPASDRLIAELAARQRGVVSAAQLLALSLDRSAIVRRVRAGRLHPVTRGVFSVGHPHLSREGRYLAAVLAGGPGVLVSHVSAAVLWGLLDHEPQSVDVTVVRKLRSRPAIRMHWTRQLPAGDHTLRNGIPVTSPVRTILDLACTSVSVRALRRAVRGAEVQGLVTVAQLTARLAKTRGRRGTARLRELIGEGPAPTRSELEDRTLDLLLAHGFPRPAINARIAGLTRPVEVDFRFPELRLIIEADGARYHRGKLAGGLDAARQAMLETAGYRVVRVSWTRITRDRDQTARRLRRVFATQAAARAAGDPSPTSRPRPLA